MYFTVFKDFYIIYFMPCFCSNKCVTTGTKVAKLNFNFACAGLATTACALRSVYQSSVWYTSLQAVQTVSSPDARDGVGVIWTARGNLSG